MDAGVDCRLGDRAVSQGGGDERRVVAVADNIPVHPRVQVGLRGVRGTQVGLDQPGESESRCTRDSVQLVR